MKNIQQDYWKKVFKYVPYLRFIPGVRMVAVCNNLAFDRANENSDIDLFFIVRRYHLYTVRFFAILLFQILGVRRYGSKTAGRFCLSFFMDDSDMDLSRIAIERDYYLAFWIMKLKPVIDDGIALNFWRQNAWIATFFEDKKYNVDLSKAVLKPFSFNWFPFFEPLFFLIQFPKIKLSDRKRKKDSPSRQVIVSSTMLKFHELDRRKFYRDKWILKNGFSKIKDNFFIF